MTDTSIIPFGDASAEVTEAPKADIPFEGAQPTNGPADKYLAIWNQTPVGKQRLIERFGSGYQDEDFVDSLGDSKAAWKIGWAQNDTKKREVLKEIYGDQADFQTLDFGKDGKFSIATKDGKVWKNGEGAYKYLKDVPSAIAGTLTGAGPEAGPLMRLLKPSAISGTVKGIQESFLKKMYEPERSSPYEAATQEFIGSAIGQAFGDFAIAPLIRRTVGVTGSPGAEKAVKAAESEGMAPLLGGQFTENKIVQSQFKQLQQISEDSNRKALERFKSLKVDGLEKWISEMDPNLDQFSGPEIKALAERAAFDIDTSVNMLSSGSRPIGAVLPRLKSALDVFNKAASKEKNKAYDEAFDVAVKDYVELDFSKVKGVFDEIEKGVPVVPDAPSGEPIRYLTPSAELQRMIDTARQIRDNVSPHNPDGSVVGALQQMNAVRRQFSEFAWDNVGNNQGRLATQVLDAIDESIANPINAGSDAYKAAFKKAQEQYGAWRSVLEIKKISNLSNADLSTYQSYVANLVKPGNGPVVELMDKMFKGTPGAMDDVRSTYIDYLVHNPEKIDRYISDLEKNDPRLLKSIIPNKGDLDILRSFSKEKQRYDKSWISRNRDTEALSNGQRALDLLDHSDPSKRAQNIADFYKYGGPRAEENLQTAFVHKLLKESETEDATAIGDRVIDADKFTSMVNTYEDDIAAIFKNPRAKERLMNLYNYGLKIKQTAVGVPKLKAGPGSGNSGESIMGAQAGSAIGHIPDTIEKRGPTAAARKLFSIFITPRIVAKLMSLNEPVRKTTKMAVKPETLENISTVTRILPGILAEDRANYDGPGANDLDNVYTP